MPKLSVPAPGDRFGQMAVLATGFGLNARGHRIRKCVMACDCGSVSVVWKHNLTSGHTLSCGCQKVKGNHKTHGHTAGGESRTYKSWTSMISRCRDPNNPHYAHVSVCERWQSFENFLADMGERPDGTTLDRLNSDGNYEPGNVRWATPKQQSENRRPWKHTEQGLKNISAARRRSGV